MKQKRLISTVFTVVAMITTVLAFSANANAQNPNLSYDSTIGKALSGTLEGIALDSSGNVWAATYGGGVTGFTPSGEQIAQFSVTGLRDIKIDSSNHIWVSGNGSKLREFSTKGEEIGSILSGHLIEPYKFTIDSSGNFWVIDSYYRSLVELNSKGEYLKEFSLCYGPEPGECIGEGEGQFNYAAGIAVGPEGYLWITDHAAKGRVEKFSTAGKYQSQAGQGYLTLPEGDPVFDSEGHLWVTDTGSGHFVEFDPAFPTNAPLQTLGTEGEGPGQLVNPTALAFDASGNMWVGEQEGIERWSPPLVTTPKRLNGMAVTEPFNGNTTSFNANWLTLRWLIEKGSDEPTGWRPAGAFQSGAYLNSYLTDTGSGNAVVATMAVNPSNLEDYFSLWLDTPGTGSQRWGYELRFTKVGTSSYDVALSRWDNGTRHILASKSAYGPFNNNNRLALVDEGGTVSAWAQTGASFTQILSVGDSVLYRGYSGVEGEGNITRLTNFEAGALLAPVSNMDEALKSLALRDSFRTNESPLSVAGSWAKCQRETGTGQVSGGWGPLDAYPASDGADWRTGFPDTGTGVGAAATLVTRPSATSNYFSLWVDDNNCLGAKTGYELRFTQTSPAFFEVALLKWQSGVKTVLASKSGCEFLGGWQFALVDKGGTVSAWTWKGGGEYSQLLSATDSAFANGYTGIEAAGTTTRLKNFRSGPLPPF
jgi:streptogramin lyase